MRVRGNCVCGRGPFFLFKKSWVRFIRQGLARQECARCGGRHTKRGRHTPRPPPIAAAVTLSCRARCLLRTFFFDAKQSKFFPLNSFIHMSATAPVGGAAAASTATQTITATTPSLPPLPPTLQQIADPSLNASTCPLFSHCQPHFLSLEVCWHEQACCLSAVRENSSGVNG